MSFDPWDGWIRPVRLRPLELDADQLAERRRVLMLARSVAMLSNGWAAEVWETRMLDCDWFSMSFIGRVAACPLGVSGWPVGDFVSFEPCHVTDAFRWFDWERLGPRAPWKRRPGLPLLERSIPRTRGALRRAANLPPRPRHVAERY